VGTVAVGSNLLLLAIPLTGTPATARSGNNKFIVSELWNFFGSMKHVNNHNRASLHKAKLLMVQIWCGRINPGRWGGK
jgi:hypothetical protein